MPQIGLLPATGHELKGTVPLLVVVVTRLRPLAVSGVGMSDPQIPGNPSPDFALDRLLDVVAVELLVEAVHHI